MIVLSGPSCSGKTSLATALRERLSSVDRPFLHAEADRLLPHLPEGSQLDGSRSHSLSRALHRAVAAFAAEGFDIIVDGVLPYGNLDGIADAFEVFGAFRLCRVGVHCDVGVLERREGARPDRVRGWARHQAADLHLGHRYDVEVDTTSASPAECAEAIFSHLQTGEPG